jgi:hypothetical protein
MTVTCSRHGAAESRFLCQHLTPESAALGFVVSPDGTDGWCGACDAVWSEEGEWNDRVERQLDIKHVCSQCFDEIAARNA